MPISLRFHARFRPCATTLVAALLLAACSGGGTDTVSPPAVSSVSVSPNTVSLQGVGATATVSAAIAPSGASGTVSWRSDAATIASVSGSGSSATITAVAAGTTTIVGSVGGVSGSTTVTVIPIVRGITPSRTTAGVLVGGTTSLTATLSADAGASGALTWSSSTPTVATVDASGIVSGVTPGTSTITVASTAFPAISATIAVTVAYPVVRSVTVAPTNPAVLVSGTRQMTATVDADAGTPTVVTWTSSAPNVASISGSGLVTALAAGTTTIRATSSANPTISGTTTLTVTAPTLRSIAMTPTAAAVTAGDVQQFALTIDADAGASTAVTWTSSNLDVATVNASGLVSTLSTGTTTITATSVLVPAVRAQATLTVLTPPLINGWQQRALTPPTTELNYDVDEVWSVNNGLAFAIGGSNDGERRVLAWDGVVWNYEQLSPFDNISALGGAGSEVFIGSATGRIARYLTFSAAASGFTEMTIPAVGCIRRIASAGTAARIALASTTSNCFTSRAILLYQGSTWTRLPDPPALTTVSDITSSAPNNIVAVGNGGTGIQRWDGAGWTSVSAPPTAGTPQSVALLGADIVVATGAAAAARLTGATWTSIAPPTPRANAGGLFLTRVRACNGQLYSGTTFDGRMYRLDGTAWTEIATYGVAVPGSYTTQATCGADNVLRVAGTDGSIGRSSGSAWVWETSTPYLFKSAIVRSDLAYAVGGHGVVQRWNGTRWQIDLSISSFGYLDKLSASDDGLVLASGAGGPTGLWRKSGGSWSFDALPYTPSVIWAASNTFALSVGSSSSAASQFNGSSWQSITPPPAFNPAALDGVSATFAIAVGGTSGANGARAYRWTGSAWDAMTLPTGHTNLVAVDVVSPTLAYAVSSTNALLRYNGTQWSVITGPSASAADLPVRAVAATGASDVYLLSSTGALFHYDGAAWIRLARFTSSPDVSPYYTSLSIARGIGLITGAFGEIYHGANGAMIRSAPMRRR